MSTAKKAAKKSAKKTSPRTTRIVVASNVKITKDAFKLIEGLPLARLQSTPEEQDMIYNTLAVLQANKQHFVVPPRLKSTVLRMAQRDFPQYVLRTSFNKAKNTVAIWRTK